MEQEFKKTPLVGDVRYIKRAVQIDEHTAKMENVLQQFQYVYSNDGEGCVMWIDVPIETE